LREGDAAEQSTVVTCMMVRASAESKMFICIFFFLFLRFWYMTHVQTAARAKDMESEIEIDMIAVTWKNKEKKSG
jgi:hypothetical protein